VSAGTILRGLGHLIGIFLIFSVVGPLAFAALVLMIVAGFGAPLLHLVSALTGMDTLGTVVSIALWVLAIAAVLAASLPSVVAGFIFGVAAVCAGLNAVWMAWLAAAVGVAVIIMLGASVVPSESSAVILPSVQSAGQSIPLFTVLTALAVLPATLCWWLAKPLHRATIAA
jgi:hypothetical protein